jgi:hypothetical protein
MMTLEELCDLVAGVPLPLEMKSWLTAISACRSGSRLCSPAMRPGGPMSFDPAQQRAAAAKGPRFVIRILSARNTARIPWDQPPLPQRYGMGFLFPPPRLRDHISSLMPSIICRRRCQRPGTLYARRC